MLKHGRQPRQYAVAKVAAVALVRRDERFPENIQGQKCQGTEPEDMMDSGRHRRK